MTPLKPSIVAIAIATFAWLCAMLPTMAQTPAQVGDQVLPAPRPAPPRIEIHPGRLLYRRCTDWYELQYRPSGTVLYPQYRCWWVRG